MTYYPSSVGVFGMLIIFCQTRCCPEEGCWKLDVEGKEKFPGRVEGRLLCSWEAKSNDPMTEWFRVNC